MRDMSDWAQATVCLCDTKGYSSMGCADIVQGGSVHCHQHNEIKGLFKLGCDVSDNCPQYN